VGLFRHRRAPEPEPERTEVRPSEPDPVELRLGAYRAEAIAAPAPSLPDLLQRLGVPHQPKGEHWLADVGSGWATFTWLATDATLLGFLMYEQPPGASADLLRANSETGLACYDASGQLLLTKVLLPAEDLDRAALTLAFGALRREAGGSAETPLGGAPEAGVEDALVELGGAPSGVAITPRGDILDLRIELEQGCEPNEAVAEWLLEFGAGQGARLGIDDGGKLCAIAAIPARPVSAGGLAWALGEVLALARTYRAASQAGPADAAATASSGSPISVPQAGQLDAPGSSSPPHSRQRSGGGSARAVSCAAEGVPHGSSTRWRCR
jgi:hypothetical protein